MNGTCFPSIHAGVNFMFEYVSEETLREILCVVHGLPAAADEAVKRRPIDLAKLC